MAPLVTFAQLGLASLALAGIYQTPQLKGEDGLPKWLELKKSATVANLTKRMPDLGYTPALAPLGLFVKRQDQQPGEGALLCENGECPDKR